ncbi:MAG: hypothetical protein RIQ56_770, partial [Candidatus Parcubacteria bacterium]
MSKVLSNTSVVISQKALVHNLKQFKRAAELPVAPVIKSNAYGHGLELVGKILDRTDIPLICVNSLEEAVALRRAKVLKPLLVIGYTPPRVIRKKPLRDCSFMVGSIKDLRVLLGSRARIHLKIDTGMHRQGIQLSEIDQAVRLISNKSEAILEGIMSHLADADGEDDFLSDMQISAWNKEVQKFRATFPRLEYWHIAATTGIRLSRKIDANLVRLGIGLYGMNVSRQKMNLKPVLEVRSVIASLRKLKKGDRVGYNGTFTVEDSLTIATVPLGYYEGIDRRLSNKGYMLVQGITCPIIGRVSMN